MHVGKLNSRATPPSFGFERRGLVIITADALIQVLNRHVSFLHSHLYRCLIYALHVSFTRGKENGQTNAIRSRARQSPTIFGSRANAKECWSVQDPV